MSQSVIAEVYTLNSLATMAGVFLGLRWREDRSPRWLYGMALVVGLLPEADAISLMRKADRVAAILAGLIRRQLE